MAVMTDAEYEKYVEAHGGNPTACRTALRNMIKIHGGPNTGETCNWTTAQIRDWLTGGLAEIKADTAQPETQGKGSDSPSPAPAQPELPAQQDEQSEEQKALEELRRIEEENKRRQAEAEELKKRLEKLRKEAAERAKREAEERKKKMQGTPHYKSDEVVETLKTTGLAYVVGPAGSGKTTLAMDACVKMFDVKKGTEEFNKVFAQISFSPDTLSTDLIGMPDVNGNFHESEVVRVFREGGIILFDEVDAADPSILVKVNTMLANGTVATPNGVSVKHAQCYIIVAANTFGTGPDAMYVGRNRLDAATLDRFVMSTIEVGYDTKLEESLMKDLTEPKRKELQEFVKNVRSKIEANHMQRLCSTRFVINSTKWLANGKDMKFIKDRYFLGWTPSEVKAVS